VSTTGPSTAAPDAGGRTAKRERRGWERHSLNEAEGKLIYRHTAMTCSFVDISLSGCCIRMEKRFAAGALAKVEVLFDLHGAPQRIAGITQWIGKGNELGIRFVHPTPQAKNQFSALLIGLIDETAAETVKEAVASGAVAQPKANLHVRSAASAIQPAQPIQAEAAPAVEVVEGEARALIRFLKDGSQVAAAVTDLSLEGCTLHLARAFALATYARVEISFHIRGLAFQLAGVSQEVRGKNTAVFRFLDVSRRRREELAQAIEEMRAVRERQS